MGQGYADRIPNAPVQSCPAVEDPATVPTTADGTTTNVQAASVVGAEQLAPP